MTAVVGIAGRVLWLYESLEPDAAASALELMNHLRPPARRSIYNYFIAELLRPFIGLEPTRALLRRQPPTHDAAARILYLRTRLPVLALDRDHDALGRAIADARRVAHDACAPALGWIADWAAGAQATADSPADALMRWCAPGRPRARWPITESTTLLRACSSTLRFSSAGAAGGASSAKRRPSGSTRWGPSQVLHRRAVLCT